MGRVRGVETEYGLVGRADGRRLPADEAGQRLFAPLATELATTNAFLPGGGRLYLDIGSHPEYATPECLDAADTVTAQRAGDALMLDLAARAAEHAHAHGVEAEFRLFRNNVDAYGNTWGSHENHLVSRDTDPGVLEAWLVPFLVSRSLIGGTGHWRRGRFTLSQRGDVLGDLVSNQTTRSRPLINTRDEPHADPSRHRRLHVIAGDTHSLEHPMWLALVASELVLRCAEAGGTPPPGPASPLAALRAWNLDPDAGVTGSDGGTVTARGVLRAWLARAADVADDADETGPGWRAWATMLDALDAGRPSGAEWDAKRRLIERHRDRHGLAVDDPRLDALDLRWHEVGTGLARQLEAGGGSPRVTTDAAVGDATRRAPSASRARVRGQLVTAAREHGREYAADWAWFAVHDLAGEDGTLGVRLALEDPFAATDAAADALIAAMASDPRHRVLGGFVPPPTR